MLADRCRKGIAQRMGYNRSNELLTKLPENEPELICRSHINNPFRLMDGNNLLCMQHAQPNQNVRFIVSFGLYVEGEHIQ